MTLSTSTVQRCAYVVGDEIARRQRTGVPIPQTLMLLHRELLDEVSGYRLRQQWTREASQLAASGHSPSQTAPAPEQLESTADVARRLGLSPRTVRRHAAANGAHRIGNRWVYERQEESIQ